MVPRVASWYESRLGRNDGNPLYVTYVMKRDYVSRGVLQYDHLAPDPNGPLPGPDSILGCYDLNLWVDWAEDALRDAKTRAGQPLLHYEPIACPSPGLYWVSDTHLGWDYRKKKAAEFDYIMAAQKQAAMNFKALYPEKHVEWMPHAVETDAYNPLGIYTRTPEQRAMALTAVSALKRHDVSFVGFLTFRHRLEFLDDVFKRCAHQGISTWYASRFFEQAAKIFTESRIVLNHCVNDDVNMRIFEVLATRSFLLTPRIPSLGELFTDGEHLVTYDDGDPMDCFAKIEYWLGRPEAERLAIADAGYRHVLANHTMAHRVQRMLDVAGLDIH